MPLETPNASPDLVTLIKLGWEKLFGSLRKGVKDEVDKRKQQAESPGEKLFLGFLGTILSSDDETRDTDEKGNWLERLLGGFDDKRAEGDAAGIGDPNKRQRAFDRLGNIRALRGNVSERAKEYIPMIHRLIREKGFAIPPSVFIGLVAQESGFNTQARSPANCHGLAQLLPSTAEEVARRHPALGIDPQNAKNPEWLRANPEQNLLLGMQYLQNLKQGLPPELRSSPDVWYFTLASYNGGPGNFSKSLKQFHGAHPGQVPTWEGIRPYLVSQENRQYAPLIAQKIDQYVGSDNPLTDTNG